jgi:hypothetical protein
MARIPAGAKVSKVCSKDAARPVLVHPAIVEVPGEIVDGVRTTVKALAATDSYRLVIVPLEDAEQDTCGSVDVALVKAAEGGTRKRPSTATVSRRDDGATVFEDFRVSNESTLVRDIGTFPNVAALIPDDSMLSGFVVGLNAKYLHELAQAMGSRDGVVQLQFVAEKETGAPSALRPMIVTCPAGVEGARGLLMPVRAR